MWSYVYNLDNLLIGANKPGSANSLIYDGDGRLTQTTLAGVNTYLIYDGNDLVAEYDNNGALLRRYVHGPGVDEPLVWYDGSGTANKTWLYSDHQGSIVATANSAGTSTATLSYGPYGEPNATTGVRFRYTGQQLLGPLNLYYYKARMYSPAIGRFLQTDPIGYGDGLNWYAYVGNNPFNRNDPSGLTAREAWTLASGIGGRLRDEFTPRAEGFESAPSPLAREFARTAFAFGDAANQKPAIELTFAVPTMTLGTGGVNAAEDFFAGTKYTDKVLGQMKQGDFHAFPESVKAFQEAGKVSKITGGDGVARDMLKIPGEYRGKQGDFEFIKEADGFINHRLFKPTQGQ
ncbi:MAG: RHS repeat-associated core domain-containing protein [Methylococcaceae bacterium]|nr:RHS repeat-associated core domain-containing protein [Methylococcaceae bacterium]MDP3932857.1 RHS repeat-associated core domain-containing protein [Methylococcaceae bacterium]